MNGGSIKTSGVSGAGNGDGSQIYGQATNGAVTLESDMTLTASVGGAGSGGTIIFYGTLNSPDCCSPHALTTTSTGDTTFTGALGNNHPLSSLTASITGGAGNTINVEGGEVYTTGSQTYNQAVAIGGGTPLVTTMDTSANGGSITFGGALDDAVSGQDALYLNAGAGSVAFSGAVGGGTTLGSLTVNTSGTTTIGSAGTAGAVATTGSQHYGGNVSLGNDTTLTAGNAINFEGTVAGGGKSLTTTSYGDTMFNGTVSGLNSLDAAVSASGTGSIYVNSPVTAASSVELSNGVAYNSSNEVANIYVNAPVTAGSSTPGTGSVTITGSNRVDINADVSCVSGTCSSGAINDNGEGNAFIFSPVTVNGSLVPHNGSYGGITVGDLNTDLTDSDGTHYYVNAPAANLS
jgi:hypothetical protein